MAQDSAEFGPGEAWEECLQRRGLAERPGRVELQAQRDAPNPVMGPGARGGGRVERAFMGEKVNRLI